MAARVQAVMKPTAKCPSCGYVGIVNFNGKYGCNLCDFPMEVVGVPEVAATYRSNPDDPVKP